MDRDQLREHLAFAAELGVAGVSRDPDWRRRVDDAPVSREPEAGTPAVAASPTEAIASGAAPVEAEPPAPLYANRAEALAAVKADIGADCSRCKLHRLGRTQVVFGVGNPDAELMFVGEAPGGDEDIQGVPFVGRAGQLLTKIIEAIELTRDQVYIANVIKCRPPQNRNPEPDEVETCEPFLFAQIDIIQPKVIVALGTFATRALLRTMDPISRLRGRIYDYRGAKLVPTFHPAYLLRNPSSKRDVWEDMKLVKRLLTEARTPPR
ncbi:MAG: uracil-DNA glycosylase [Vicinamibacterales bacterium]